MSKTGELIQQLRNQLDHLLDLWIDRHFKETGSEPDAKAIKFAKAMLNTTVDFVQQAIDNPGKINLSTIGMLIVKRALITAGYAAGDKKAVECVVSTMTLAVTATDYFEVMVGSIALTATGEGAIVGVPILISATLYFASEARSWASVCTQAYVDSQTDSVSSKYSFPAKSHEIRRKALEISPMSFVG